MKNSGLGIPIGVLQITGITQFNFVHRNKKYKDMETVDYGNPAYANIPQTEITCISCNSTTLETDETQIINSICTECLNDAVKCPECSKIMVIDGNCQSCGEYFLFLGKHIHARYESEQTIFIQDNEMNCFESTIPIFEGVSNRLSEFDNFIGTYVEKQKELITVIENSFKSKDLYLVETNIYDPDSETSESQKGNVIVKIVAKGDNYWRAVDFNGESYYLPKDRFKPFK